MPINALPVRRISDSAVRKERTWLDTDNFSVATAVGGYAPETIVVAGRSIPRTEDALAAERMGNYYVFVVADGHGGTHRYAQLAVAYTLMYLPALLETNTPPDAFRRLCALIHNKLTVNLNRIAGGTTFTVAASTDASQLDI